MMITSSSVLLTVSNLLLFTDIFAQRETLIGREEAKLGESKILICRMKSGSKLCSWKHDRKTYYSESQSFDYGYSVVGDPKMGTCDMKIKAVSMKDNGQWNCSIAGNKFDRSVNLILVKKPTNYFLEYSGKTVVRDSTSTVPVLTHLGAFQVACEAKGSMPKANITWEGEGIKKYDYSEDSAIGPKNDGTFDVRSVLTAKMPQNYRVKKKVVTCVITYSKQKERPIRIKAIFGEEYGTTEVSLKSIHGANQKEIVLSCEADGIPEPRYHIVMTSPTNETQLMHRGQNRTVTEGGAFVCLAGNYHNGHLIKSNETWIEANTDDGSNDKLGLAKTGIFAGISLLVIAAAAVVGGLAYHFWKQRENKPVERKENLSRQNVENSTTKVAPREENKPLTYLQVPLQPNDFGQHSENET